MSADLQSLLDRIGKGEVAPAYLFTGADEQPLRDAARRVSEAIVPEADRAFDLVRHESDVSPATVADDLCSISLLGSRRVVVVLGATFLTSGRDLGAVVRDLVALWNRGKEAESTRKAVALLSQAGFARDDIAKNTKKTLGALGKAFGLTVVKGDEVDRWREALHARLLDEGREIPPPSGGAAALEAALRDERSAGNTLVLTARKADRGSSLAKWLRKNGAALSLDVSAGRDADRMVDATLQHVCRELGLRLDGGARSLLGQRVRPDPETIRREVEKLTAYADGDTLTAADVDVLISTEREDPIYMLQSSFGERDLPGTLARVHAIVGGTRDGSGEAIRLVGSLANEVRRLLRARTLLDGPLRGRLSGRTSSRAFESEVFPALAGMEGAGPLASGHPFRSYKAFQGASRFRARELVRMLRGLAALDRSLKSSPTDPLLLLERYLVEHLTPPEGRGGRPPAPPRAAGRSAAGGRR